MLNRNCTVDHGRVSRGRFRGAMDGRWRPVKREGGETDVLEGLEHEARSKRSWNLSESTTCELLFIVSRRAVGVKLRSLERLGSFGDWALHKCAPQSGKPKCRHGVASLPTFLTQSVQLSLERFSPKAIQNLVFPLSRFGHYQRLPVHTLSRRVPDLSLLTAATTYSRALSY